MTNSAASAVTPPTPLYSVPIPHGDGNPWTRSRGDRGLSRHPSQPNYYQQRASAGLIVTGKPPRSGLKAWVI